MQPSLFSLGALRRTSLPLAALALFAACATDGPSAVTDARPAALAVRALVPRTDASAGPAAVRITVGYVRQNGTVVPLGGAQQFTLDQSTQAVPVAVDVATCLADGARAGTGGAAPAADECNVQLTLEFLLNGLRVDQQVLSNVSVKPGQTSTVSQPVALAQVSDVRVVLPPANTQQGALRLEAGASAALSVQVIDANGQTLTGRTVTWSSANPAIATVNSAGVVTGVAVGGTQITASVAGRDVGTATVVTVPSQLVTVASTGASGQGRVLSSPSGIDCLITGTQTTGVCAVRFPADANVQLAASAGSGSDFATFTGDCSAIQGATCTVVPTAARRVSVGFRARQTLTVSGASSGSGTVVASDGTISCTIFGASASGPCAAAFAEGATVQLTAAATGGSAFQGWQGDCASASGATCTLTMDRARATSPRFVGSAALIVRGAGSGFGTVSSQPAGIACSVLAGNTEGACTTSVLIGNSITLTPVPASGSEFIGWSGACSGSAACTVTLAQLSEVTATFRQLGVPLTITLSGPSGGSVTTSNGQACASTGSPVTCTILAAPGSTLRVTGNPGQYLRFTGFTTLCAGLTSCDLVMNQPRSISAAFTTRPATMWLVLSGSGAGTVNGTDGFTCTLADGQGNRSCSTTVTAGTPVQFSPSPASGSAFGGWSGPCSGTSSCSLLADDVTLSGVFRTIPTVVRVQRAEGAGGSGQVIFGSENNRCTITSTGTSGRCSVEVVPNSTMTFTIDPSVGFPFAGWGGACASFGTNPVCTITVKTSVDVTARFQSPPSL
ncbi:MAG: Ig-like domain-containing protein [Gemmatimonadaceae bacterium]|nr:Ig-like domain-containing protein [Gemmatimonadaceae bacterium]